MKNFLLSLVAVFGFSSISVKSLAQTANAGADMTICQGASVTLSGSATGGSPPYTYSWSPSTGLSNTTIANPNASPTVTTTYTLSVSDYMAIWNMDQVIVNVNPSPAPPTGIGASACGPSSVMLNATGGGGTIQWFSASIGGTTLGTGNSYTTPVISSTTTYYVGSISGGCVSTSRNPVTATINPIPTLTASNSTICWGQSATLSATASPGGGSYSWSTTQTSSSINVSPTTTTNYQVQYTLNGCPSSVYTSTVTVNQPPSLNGSSTSVSCFGGSNGTATVTASGGASPYSYNWSPSGGTSATATGLAAGSYTIQVTDNNGCTTPMSINISQPPALNISLNKTDVTCNGLNNGTISSTVSGGTPAYLYSWNPTGLSSTSINNLSPGTYNLYITDANGCSQVQSIGITQPNPVALNAGSDLTICSGETANLNASGASTYSWSPSANLSNPNIPNPIASPTQTTDYTVTGTDVNGCTGTDTILVIVNSTPSAPSASNNSPVCEGSSITLNASTIAGATYSWTGPNGFISSSQNPNISSATAADAGTYSVTATVSGCTSSVATTSVIVNVIPSITAAASPTQICYGSSTMLTATDAINYSWSPGSLLTVTSGSPVMTLSTLVVGTYTLTVTGTSSAGCTNTDTTVFVVNSIPSVSATATPSVICTGETTALTATGGNTYTWSPGTGLTATTGATTSPINTFAAGSYTYTVTGTSSTGCSGIDTTVLIINSQEVASFSYSSNSYCSGTVNQLPVITGTLGGSFSSTSGLIINPATGELNINASTPGTYQVTYTTNGSCPTSSNFTFDINPTPPVNAGFDLLICDGTSGTLSATGAGISGSYSWSPSFGLSSTTDSTVSANPSTTTAYLVTGTSLNGCSSSDTVLVSVIPSDPVSVILNADQTNICFGDSVIFTSSVSNGGTSPFYQWYVNGVVVTGGTNSSFSSSTLNNGDSVYVSVVSSDSCNNSDTAYSPAIYMNVTSATGWVNGTVTVSGSNASSGTVYLYLLTSIGAFEIADSTNISNGNYSFSNVPIGSYIVSTEVDKSIYAQSVKTFYPSVNFWNQADTIMINCGTNATANIEVIELAQLTGNAVISGTVLSSTVVRSLRIPGDPVPGVDVSLEQNPGGIVVGNTTTDTNGNYTFDNVPQGDYTIFVDIPGLDMTGTYDISVTQNDTVFTDNDFFVDSTGTIDTISSVVTQIYDNTYKNSFSVYPNPHKEQLFFEYELSLPGFVQIEIYNLLGEKIATVEDENKSIGKHKISLQSADYLIKPGVYFIRYSYNNQNNTIKIIKQ